MDREKVIKDNAIRGLQNAIEISGAVVHLRKEHVKVILSLLKEQEDTINELQNAYGYLQKQFFEAQDKLLKEQEAQIELSDNVNELSILLKAYNLHELVKCKDCKYGEPGACGDGVDCDGVWHCDDWYCADGIRREDNA